MWIAGGVGVAPFLSWLRGLDGTLSGKKVDFFYSAEGEPPFAEEIEAIAEQHAELEVHVVDTAVEGRLTPERVLDDVNGDVSGVSVFMCGPTGMLRTFQPASTASGDPGSADPSRALRLALTLSRRRRRRGARESWLSGGRGGAERVPPGTAPGVRVSPRKERRRDRECPARPKWLSSKYRADRRSRAC